MGGTVETATHIFHIRNMHCADCATLIDDTLRALPGVQSAHATLRTRKIHVELDPGQVSPATVSATITELGFQLKPPPEPPRPTASPVEPQMSDPAWQVLEPLFRAGTATATRTGDERLTLEGIAYKYRHDAPWREVPAKFGPWQTLYARLVRWRKDGTMARMAAAARDSAFAGELAWLESAGD